jgi:hypothetical protein
MLRRSLHSEHAEKEAITSSVARWYLPLGLWISALYRRACRRRLLLRVDQDANIIVGQAVNENMEGEIQVTVIATGFDTNQPLKQQRIKNRLSNQSFYNSSDKKETGASIPEFLRLRQNQKNID